MFFKDDRQSLRSLTYFSIKLRSSYYLFWRTLRSKILLEQVKEKILRKIIVSPPPILQKFWETLDAFNLQSLYKNTKPSKIFIQQNRKMWRRQRTAYIQGGPIRQSPSNFQNGRHLEKHFVCNGMLFFDIFMGS